ncbi:MAG: type II toxin-antitoxin system RelE/ParE family toxin [Flavobacteriales bacterium]|nr:type II toxin-antitoxin system RelE/ParE family toxin [Flavobacteriales bacterium]
MVKINWLESSKHDLKEIYEYIAKDSKKYAKFQVNKIIKKVQKVKSQVYIGKVVLEMKDETIREIVEGNYRIVYRVISEYEVDILLIHHGARSLEDRF